MGSVREDEIESRFRDICDKLGVYIDKPDQKSGHLKYIYDSFTREAVTIIHESSEWIIIAHVDGTESRISLEEIAIEEIAIIDEMLSYCGYRTSQGDASMPQNVSNENVPPKRAEMLLHFGLPKRDREYMIGDLEEEYRTVILPKYGPGVAARWYWWQAVRSVAAASGARVRVWLGFSGLAKAAGWIVEKFGL